jgi:hypothetical protein
VKTYRAASAMKNKTVTVNRSGILILIC